MQDRLIQDQLAYYRARAAEYDESVLNDTPPRGAGNPTEAEETAQAREALRALGPCNNALELAGGTGIWTQELAGIAADLTVLDGSPEMLAINKAKLHDERIRYTCVDLFEWVPVRTYDLVFFSFWLSHVPPDRLGTFLDKVRDSVTSKGFVFILDEPADGQMLSGPVTDGMFQERALKDGRVFSIVKVYYDPLEILGELKKRGFTGRSCVSGSFFYHLAGQKD